MQYDGTGKLAEALAGLYGCSPRNHNKIAELMKNAKADLGMTSKARNLPDTDKLAIYRWHYQRLNPVQDFKRDNTIQLPDNTDSANTPELAIHSIVYDVKQNAPVQQYVNNSHLTIDDYHQIHFAVTINHQKQPKRTTVMLEGYLVKALQRKHGLPDNTAIRAWIEQAIRRDGNRFDTGAPLTKQVKRIVIESFV
jgi:predicted DNA binding CopG/RHH family protein